MTGVSIMNLQGRCFQKIRRAEGLVHGLLLLLLMAGCTSWQAPERLDEAVVRARAVTVSERQVRLSATVLSAEESRRWLGGDVNGEGIQPVWIEVKNMSADALWLLRAGTDPNYFSPLEVAWSFHATFGKEHNASIDAHFNSVAFTNPIPAGATRSGIVFTNPHRAVRLLNVDLLGSHKMIPFSLILRVPDDPADPGALRLLRQYAETGQQNIQDEEAFRAALEQMPCCAVEVRGKGQGGPINVVLVGSLMDSGAALQRRGFRSIRFPTVDAVQLFGRPPDLVMRKPERGVALPYWLRIWSVPLQYRSQQVVLVQAGRPIGGRLASGEEDDLPIHPDVDEVRNVLVQDLMYSGGLAALGYVRGAGSDASPTGGGQEEPLVPRTDGLRAVMYFATRPLALGDIQLLDWEPYLKQRTRPVQARADAPAQ
jgi:hypothetical protein